MEKFIQRLSENKNLNLKEIQNKLNIDFSKKEYTIEEIQKISKELKVSLRDMFETILHINNCYSKSSLQRALDNNEVEKVISTVACNHVVNVNGEIYFALKHNRIIEREKLSEEYSMKLLKLLLENGEWELARSLSSKNMFYRFDKLDNNSMKYLLGESINGMLSPDYFFKEAYSCLNQEYKDKVYELMLNHYKNIVNVCKSSEIVEKGDKIIIIKQPSSDGVYGIYLDDSYEAFEDTKKEEIIKLLNEIK